MQWISWGKGATRDKKNGWLPIIKESMSQERSSHKGMCVYKQDIKIYKAKLDRPKGRHNNSNYCRRILIPLLGGASRI